MATTAHLNELRKELIKRRMQRTRASLAGKIQALGARLQGAAETVESVKETVESAVDTVQSTVQTTVETVQNVREQFDVRKNPMLMLGGSVLAGYLAGVLLHRRTPPTPAPAMPFVPAPAPAAPSAPRPGPLSGLLDQGKRLGLGAVLGLVRDLIARELPPETRPMVMDYGNEFITQLGGEPPGPLLSEPEEGGEHNGRHETEMGRPLGPVEREGQASVGPAHRR